MPGVYETNLNHLLTPYKYFMLMRFMLINDFRFPFLVGIYAFFKIECHQFLSKLFLIKKIRQIKGYPVETFKNWIWHLFNNKKKKNFYVHILYFANTKV